MPTDQELRHLKQLFAKRERAHLKERECSDELCLAVWRIREQGVSARNLAKLLNVGASTVHGWTKAGKRLEQGEG